MLVCKLVVIVLALIWAIRALIRYDPKVDIIKSYNKYVIILWYTEYYIGSVHERKHIKLFSI